MVYLKSIYISPKKRKKVIDIMEKYHEYPCYAMQMAKRFGKVKTYEEWCEPKLVENALELLDCSTFALPFFYVPKMGY